jgi:hypothetical protein
MGLYEDVAYLYGYPQPRDTWARRNREGRQQGRFEEELEEAIAARDWPEGYRPGRDIELTATITPEDLEFDRRVVEELAAASRPTPKPPAKDPELEERLVEAKPQPQPSGGAVRAQATEPDGDGLGEELEALKSFKWGEGVEIDPTTGRPAQRKEVFLGDTGATLAPSRRPGTGYTPPDRGGTVSIMSHPEQGQAGADVGSMSPTQLRAHREVRAAQLEEALAQADEARLEAMIQDPYAAEQAQLKRQLELERGRAAGRLAVEEGTIEAEQEAEAQQRKEYKAELAALEEEEKREVAELESMGLSEDEQNKWELEIRLGYAAQREDLRYRFRYATRRVTAREEDSLDLPVR